MRVLRVVIGILFFASAAVVNGQGTSSAGDLINMGIELYERGAFDGAIEQYRAALKIDPKDSRAQYELTLTLVAQQKIDEALPAAERGASMKSPNQPAFLDLYGQPARWQRQDTRGDARLPARSQDQGGFRAPSL